MEIKGYVACITEGAAEKAIIDLLLDNHVLCFDRSDLLDEEIMFFLEIDRVMKVVLQVQNPMATEINVRNCNNNVAISNILLYNQIAGNEGGIGDGRNF